MRSSISIFSGFVVFMVLALVVVCVAPAHAGQAGTAAAALNGTVRDASGAVVPGAKITLTNTGTGFKQVTESNSTGNYSLVNISPGNYIVVISKEGFTTEKKRVHLGCEPDS